MSLPTLSFAHQLADSTSRCFLLTPTKNCRVHFFTFITIYLANFLFARAARTCLPGSKKANKKGEIENTKLHFILGKISGILQSLFSWVSREKLRLDTDHIQLDSMHDIHSKIARLLCERSSGAHFVIASPNWKFQYFEFLAFSSFKTYFIFRDSTFLP